MVCTVSIAHGGGGPVLNPDNNHYYELVFSDGANWEQSRDAAAAMSYMGMPGHLVTIASAAEQTFITSNFSAMPGGAPVFLGGTDEGDEGNWSWITGEPWIFESWDGGEPDGDGTENCLGTFNSSFNWHDLGCTDRIEDWYIVEYEGQVVPAIPLPALAGLFAFLILGSFLWLRRRTAD
ncbi:MAG: lectin-like protein [Acidobacteriota bacterium]